MNCGNVVALADDSLGGEVDPDALDVPGCITDFKATLGKRFGKPFEKLEPIQDLRALLTAPPGNLPVHYPRSSRRPLRDGRNYEWFVGNKRPPGQHRPGGPRLALSLAPRDNQGVPLLDADGKESDG